MYIVEVDSIEICVVFCCVEQICDLVLVLGENCYVGDCVSKEFCVFVLVYFIVNKGLQIVYIILRKKVEELGIGQLIKKKLNFCFDFKRFCL